MDLDISRFADPRMFALLGILPVMIAVYVCRQLRGGAAVTFPSTDTFPRKRTFRRYLRHIPFVLRVVAVAMIVLALARPQGVDRTGTSLTEGVDIVIALDISGSMLARDFIPDRMTAAKETAAKFINDRISDRIGLVVFAGESFTQSPLTTDKATLLNLLAGVHSGVIEDGTAIGNGLATAINRLRESETASKVIILLTDGVNNAGQIAPMTAAELANTFGIRVYTVGIGSMGTAPMPGYDRWGRPVLVQAPVEIDEEILTHIADMTGGKYFRAVDNTSLEEIYARIDTLEKSRIEITESIRYEELFFPLAVFAALLLLLEAVIRKMIFKI